MLGSEAAAEDDDDDDGTNEETNARLVVDGRDGVEVLLAVELLRTVVEILRAVVEVLLAVRLDRLLVVVALRVVLVVVEVLLLVVLLKEEENMDQETVEGSSKGVEEEGDEKDEGSKVLFVGLVAEDGRGGMA